MKVSLFDTTIHSLDEIDLLKNKFEYLIKNGQYILGKNLDIFEKKLSKYLGCKYIVGVNSGTDALQISLKALGVKPDDIVITSAFTYFATVEAIHNIGAKPYVVDICKDTLQMNFEKIDKNILNKAKAIIPVHLFGGHVNVEQLFELSKKYNLKIIEDVAQSFGTKHNGKKIGTFGDCGAFSFYPTKTLGAIGDAGAISTNNKKLYEDLLKLRNHGHIDRDNFKFSGFNSRMDEIQAIFLNHRIEKIDKEIEKRILIANNYINNLSSINNLTFFKKSNKTYNYFPLLVKNKIERTRLIKHLTLNNIQTAIYYKKPISDLQFDWIYKTKNLEVVNEIKNRILCLPIYPNLGIKKQNYVIKNIRNFYEN